MSSASSTASDSGSRTGSHLRIAVVGAGIVGVTTAYELAADGHQVSVFERANSVATGTSFANAGIVAPGYVAPWAAPGMPGKVLRQLFRRHAAVRIGGMAALAELPWFWRWWRACRPAVYQANRARMQRLARYSRDRLNRNVAALQIEHDAARGLVVLLRTPRELALAQPGLALLGELGVAFDVLDAAGCRRVEPGLNADTPLQAGIRLPDDGAGNCRQFAQAMRMHAERHAAAFRFGHTVQHIEPGTAPRLVLRDAAGGPTTTESFDAVVVCAGIDSATLLQPLGLRLPLMAVHGYSISAPLRLLDAHPELGPRAALMDEKYKVAIVRLGQRLRVAGSAEVGGTDAAFNPAALRTLYRVLDDWFPGAADLSQVQRWKGARPMLPDGPPLLGASGRAGIWLNLGHGSSGWALACGSARVLADRLAGREPEIDTAGLGLDRWA